MGEIFLPTMIAARSALRISQLPVKQTVATGFVVKISIHLMIVFMVFQGFIIISFLWLTCWFPGFGYQLYATFILYNMCTLLIQQRTLLLTICLYFAIMVFEGFIVSNEVLG